MTIPSGTAGVAGAGGNSAGGSPGSSGKAGQPSVSGGNLAQGGSDELGGAAGAVATGAMAGEAGTPGAAGVGGDVGEPGAGGGGGELSNQGGAAGAGGESNGLAGASGAAGFDVGDLFGDQPGTIERSGSITKSDNVCVVIFSGGMCLAQNSPACSPGSPPANVALSLTLDAQGQLTVEAPYQDMCTSDYVGAVVDQNGTPTGGAVATSYAVPLDTVAYYTPRSIDHCRINANGSDSIVKDEIETWIEGTTLYITQLCTTHFMVIDPVYGATALTDTRSWTTKVELQ